MTTIAYRNGIIASDSLGVTNNQYRVPGKIQKVFRLKDQTLVGGSGDTNIILNSLKDVNFIEQIKSTNTFDTSTEILAIKSSGEILRHHVGNWIELGKLEFIAIGSGSAAAMGALYNGATAEEAVICASKIDIFTNDQIQILNQSNKIPILPFQIQTLKSRRKFKFMKLVNLIFSPH